MSLDETAVLGLPVEGAVLVGRPVDPTRDMYGGLQAAYEHMNRELFRPAFGLELPNCLITLRATGRTLGYFSPERFVDSGGDYTHEIAMNPAGFACRSVEVSLSTLAHEMCHLLQLVDGSIGRTTYHNQAFADRMEKIGLITSSTGKPGGKRTAQKMSHYIQPEGPFIQVIRPFLATGFRARWAERFTGALTVAWTPDHPPLPPTLEPELTDQGPDTAGLVGPDSAEPSISEPPAVDRVDVRPAGLVPTAAPTPRPADVEDPSSEGSAHQPIEPPPVALHPGRFVQGRQPSKTAKLRHKYICRTEGCGQAAWGKPKLELMCGRCRIEMIDAEAAA